MYDDKPLLLLWLLFLMMIMVIAGGVVAYGFYVDR